MKDWIGMNTSIPFSRKFPEVLPVWERSGNLFPSTPWIFFTTLSFNQFDYCALIWNNANITQRYRLQKLQNRAVRVITKSPYEIRSNDILNDLGWDTLVVRRSKHIWIMIHKIMHIQAPSYLIDQFHRVIDTTSYNLRNNDINLKLPMANTENLKKVSCTKVH